MKRMITFMIVLISVFSLVGCNQTSVPNKSIAAYMGDSVTMVDITHHIGGKTAQWIAEGEEVDRLREWAVKLEYELLEFEEGQSPGDSDGGEVYDFVLTESGFPGFSYIINGADNCYLLIDDDWFSVKNPSNPPVTKPQEEKLTLVKVKELAEKGEDLSWSDFEQYSYEDIGSGLYIYAYNINENYCLMIGGTSIQTPPMYMRLVYRAGNSDYISNGKYIDIRTESIDDFINETSN